MSNNDVIALLEELVAIPSVNPEHTSDETIANEGRMADFLSTFLETRGCSVARDVLSPERSSVIGAYGPDTPRYTLLLEAHTDTVGVGGMVIPPFTPRITQGRLYGRGACDTKGPMAACLTALQPERLDRLAEAGVKVLFIGAFGEEKGNLGAERLVEQGMGADAALILEPTELALVHAHKGALWYELILLGEAAHGSDPAKGKNAILAMADTLTWLREQLEKDVQAHQHPHLGVPTLNIGRIVGGEAMNIVAQRCAIEVDRRLVPGEDPEAIMNNLHAYLSACKDAGRIRGYEVNTIKLGLPFETQTNSAMVADLKRALEANGQAPSLATAAWYSDAGAFARTCPEVVVFGPGSIKQAHREDEYIELTALQTGQRVIASYLDQVAARIGAAGAGDA